jgi:hypothetical protein
MTLLAMTTLARVRALMQENSPTAAMDPVLTDMITAISQRLEAELGRKVMLEARTEKFSPEPYSQLLVLGAAPVTEPDSNTGLPAFTVTEALDRQFADADPIDPTTYFLDAEAALVQLDGCFTGGKGTVQVVYTAGLAATPDDLAANYPALVQAATFWVKELYDKRNQLGRSGESVSGTSVSWQDGLGDVPEIVRSLIAPWRRTVVSG